MEASTAGVHRPPVPGISGTASEGADSIVVNGGYEDDRDFGAEIIYTGAGGNDTNTGKQTEDQSLEYTNNAERDRWTPDFANTPPVTRRRGEHEGDDSPRVTTAWRDARVG